MKLTSPQSLTPSMLLGAVGAAILVAACSGAEGPDPLPTHVSPDALEQRLEADTGSRWQIVRAANVPRTLAPAAPIRLPGATPQEMARAFFAKYALDLGSDGLRDLGAAEEATLDDGAKVVHFGHIVPTTQLPVFERGTGIQVDAAGNVAFIESGLGLDFSGTETAPSVSAEGAKDAAARAVRGACGDAGEVISAVLGGWPNDAGKVFLAYRLELSAAGTCRAPIVYVHAQTGDVLRQRDESPSYFDTVRGGSSYFWNDPSDRKTIDVSQAADFAWYLRTMSAQAPVETRDYRTGATISSTSLGQWDIPDQGIAVDAHFHATRALEYFRDAHGRRGLDGRGGPLRVYVHDNSSGNYNGDNAHYLPSNASIHLGDGNPRTQRYLPFALSFDVVVHELGHGIIAHTSRLVYERESGALNESFADVMAISAKMWAPEAREHATFKLGENSVNSTIYGRSFMRDVLSPDPKIDGGYTSYTQIPKCDTPNLTVNDACHVHFASGIGNRAYAMMAVGGDEISRTGARIAVPSPMGYARAAYVWYQSVTTLANPRATFRDAALAQLKVAERIGPEARNAVGCAWAAVDVLSPAEQALWSLVCTTTTRVPKKASCEVIGNGLMCHDRPLLGAIECRNGAVAGARYCSRGGARCVQTSATDFRAVVDATGTLVCK